MWNRGYRLNDQSFYTTLPRYYLRKMFRIVASMFFFFFYFVRLGIISWCDLWKSFSMNYFKKHVVRRFPFIFLLEKKKRNLINLFYFLNVLNFSAFYFLEFYRIQWAKKKNYVRSTDRSVNGRQTDRFRVEANNRSYRRIDVLYFCEIPVNRAIETASVDSLRSRCQSLNKR